MDCRCRGRGLGSGDPADALIVFNEKITHSIYNTLPTHFPAMLAFEPISCAMALSAIEHVCCRRPDRVPCTKARVWLRRAPAEVLVDVAVSEVSEGIMDIANTVDTGVLLGVVCLILLQLSVRMREALR